MSLMAVAAFLFGLILLFLLWKIFSLPIKWGIRLLYNGIIGGILLWLGNWLGAMFGLTVAINPITALIAGFLGIPGVILLFALKWFLG